MRQPIRQLRFRSLSNSAEKRRGAAGYALLILMMAVTILLVSLTAAMPSIYVEGQREREEELIFRGNEYARAIAFFHRRFNRYPTSVDELLRTSGMRFLRRAYSDPMSRDGKWRFIHTATTGAVLDSRTLGPLPAVGNANVGNVNQEASPLGRGAATRRLPAALAGDREEKGTLIMGVASTSHKESIRVWKSHTHYDEWEFLGTEVNLAVPVPGAAQGQPGAGGRPTGPRSPLPPGRARPPSRLPSEMQ